MVLLPSSSAVTTFAALVVAAIVAVSVCQAVVMDPACQSPVTFTDEAGGYICDHNPREGGRYERDQECLWIIDVPKAGQIMLYFKRFDLQSSSDYISVSSGNGSELQRLKGGGDSDIPDLVVIEGNKAVVQFVSGDDKGISGYGFDAYYAVYISPEIDEEPILTLTVYDVPLSKDAQRFEVYCLDVPMGDVYNLGMGKEPSGYHNQIIDVTQPYNEYLSQIPLQELMQEGACQIKCFNIESQQYTHPPDAIIYLFSWNSY